VQFCCNGVTGTMTALSGAAWDMGGYLGRMTAACKPGSGAPNPDP
jgi:hypothetical protein